MPDTFITNLSHFLDESGFLVAGPPRPLARHLANIVQAATLHVAGEPFHSAIRCRRRPGHVLCPGYILVNWTDIPPEIRWECHRCGDGGVITGWEGTDWDLRELYDDENPDAVRGIAITTAQYAELRAAGDLMVIDCPEVIAGAEYHDGVIALFGKHDEFDEFAGYLAAEANHTSDRKRQALLDQINAVVEAALARIEADEP